MTVIRGVVLSAHRVDITGLARDGETMKRLDEIRAIIKQHRDVLAEKYGVAVVGIFGSCVRGKERRGSDIDLLADILRPVSLLEIVGAELYLSDILGGRVDLVPKRDVREELREIIFREAVSL